MKRINSRHMNSFKLLIPIMVMAIVFSCKPDKKAELAKLKQQQSEISDKIKKLEEELGDSAKSLTKILKVGVTEVQSTAFKHYIEVQGRLDGEDNVEVQPEGAGGIVQAVLVTTGQAVSKGQVLARLNDAPLRDQLKALESSYQLAKENFERQQRLWNQKIGSEMQYLSAKSNKETLEGQIGALKEQINMASIKAPVNGTVEEVNVKMGQIASPQLPTPAFRIVNFSTVKIKAEVAEAYSQKINVGDNVVVYFPDLDKEINAKITSASRYINPVNRTFLVEAQISPEKNGFKANMMAVLKINDYAAEHTIVVPANYIQSDLQGNFVYVAEKEGNKSVAKKIFVEQGQSYNGMVEIIKGLKDGDKVITSGYLDLEEGVTVKI
jgi:membrane fusion protein, multidrug efflux system